MNDHDTGTTDVSDAAPSAAVPREVELKLAVPPSSVGRVWAQPLLVEHAIGPVRAARVDSRYFDTGDHALAANGIALRLRRVGRQWVQTLKTRGDADGRPAGALSTRGEWEMPVAGPALELARLRDTPLAGVASTRTLARRLAPVFATNFRRETRMCRLEDGSEVEVAFDVGTIVAGRGRARRTTAICELELETRRAGRDVGSTALLRFAERLARDLPLIPLADSKAARGYRLARGDVVEPAKPALPDARGDAHPARHLAHVLAVCNDALLTNAHALLDRGAADAAAIDDRVEFVHQARVAIRRARSALRTFRPVAKGRRFDALDDALRDVGRVFGAARDQDVFASDTMARLREKIADDEEGRAAVDEIGAAMGARRIEAHRALFDLLDRGSFGATAIAVMRTVERLDATDDDRPSLGRLAPRWLDRQRARLVRPSRRIAVLDEHERHGLRIEVKRLRYALDLLQSLFAPEATRRFRDALADLQDKLGKLTDEAVARRLLSSLPDGAARDLVVARYADWFDRHLAKQLPKVAALSVAFELTPLPWSVAPAID